MDDMEHTHFVYVCTKSAHAGPFSNEREELIVETVVSAVAAATAAVDAAAAAAAPGAPISGCGAAAEAGDGSPFTTAGCGTADAQH